MTDPEPLVSTPVSATTIRARLFDKVLAPVVHLPVVELERLDSLGEAGLGSIDYIRVARGIEDEFGITFTPAKLFSHSGLDDLVTLLATQLADHVQAVPPVPQAAASGVQTAPNQGASIDPTAPISATQPVMDASCDRAEQGAIAVIGVACRFPGGANDPEAYWRHLRDGVDDVTRIADTRPGILDDYLRDHADLAGFPQHAAFTEGIAEFDAGFFGVSPMEAQAMDPQQRRLLELAWHVIESAGYRPSALRGERVGLFIGQHSADYGDLMLREPGSVDTFGAFMDSGLHPSLVANRVSRWFDFRGPSEVVNTACSSSLVAIHHAVRALRDGECVMAIAGGVNALVSSRTFACTAKAGMLSPEGRCMAFDERADGFVRAEGFGAVLLKPLTDAMRDGDPIAAVIRGTAVDHDGYSGSLRAPNPVAQRDLIEAALADAGVDAATVSYIEAHGTGTSLGDPIEIEALTNAFHDMAANLPSGSIGLGSAKTNIGHMEAAAGIGGLIKVIESLKHEALPGLLHYRRLNPFIELGDTPFRVVDSLEPWESRSNAKGAVVPRRAGVSSFGFGGTNAHVVVEEAPAAPIRPDMVSGPVPLIVSARTPDRLAAMGRVLADRLRAQPDIRLQDMAIGLLAREPMAERIALIVASRDEAIDRLEHLADMRPQAGVWVGHGVVDRGASDADSAPQAAFDWLSGGAHAEALGSWVIGDAVPWGGLRHAAEAAKLPGYPFDPASYWLTDAASRRSTESAVALHPLVRANVSSFAEERFACTWTGQEFFLRDNLVYGRAQLPRAAWVEAARASLALASGVSLDANGIRMSQLVWDATYTTDDVGDAGASIVLSPLATDGVDFDCFSQVGDSEMVYCQGRMELVDATSGAPALLPVRVETGAVDPEMLDRALAPFGIRHGQAYDAVATLHVGQGVATASLSLPDALRRSAGDYVLHPVTVTRALEIAWLAGNSGADGSRATEAPSLTSIDEVTVIGALRGVVDVVAVARRDDEGQVYDVTMCDQSGEQLAVFAGVRFAAKGKEA